MKPPLVPEADSATPVLEMRGIVKRFDTALALDGVDFSVRPGEIHALLGENGAGKSTLMNILQGLTTPTAGEIRRQNVPVAFPSPEAATRAGIGMVHQHFLLVPPFTVPENLTLAATGSQSFVLGTASLVAHAHETAARLGWALPSLNVPVADLPVGTQQRVEVLKALMGDARVLLFDEPTAVLTPQEAEELFHVMRALRDEGRSLVFVSHKLAEVMALCDRVTVLRRGHNVGTVAVSETSPQDLARRMVGGETPLFATSAPAPPVAPNTPPVLEIQGLATAASRDAVALENITLTLRGGEILGVAGVDGNGQTELAQVLTGLQPWTRGTVRLAGAAISRIHPQELGRLGIAVIPPDRHRQGLALTLSVAENLMLEATQLPQFRRGPFLRGRELRRFTEQIARDFDIRAESLNTPVSTLSGGNQQKIVIARALWRKPKLLIAVGPTRGLDVAATAYVHSRLRERQAEGGAIVLISTELDEIIALSSRIAVFYEGRIVGIVPADTPRDILGQMMGGKTPSALNEASHG